MAAAPTARLSSRLWPPAHSPRPSRPLAVLTSMTTRWTRGSWTPTAFSSGGSEKAMGVMVMSAIFRSAAVGVVVDVRTVLVCMELLSWEGRDGLACPNLWWRRR